LSEVLARMRGDSVLSRPARSAQSSSGIARRMASGLKALPTRIYVIGGLSALLVAIGVNALVLQSERHPAPLFASPPARIAPAPPPSNPIPAPAPAPSRLDSDESLPPAPVPTPPVRTGAVSTTSARAPDQIGAWLRNESQNDDSRLVLAAQNALVKLGYAVKADGNQGAATHQALRDFERAHGLPSTTEITPRLVKQLTAAARAASH
jgi:hypothetical protein